MVTKPFNTLNAELNPICHLLALLGAHHIIHVTRISVIYKERLSRTPIYKPTPSIFLEMTDNLIFVKNKRSSFKHKHVDYNQNRH